ncbi:MAG: SDR family NAD(P)-dependent oxidoreductase [Candidatus Aminicenantes bacterium]|nr:SDR family NAD(P)-dependent oxidoreductase [Candidatus Aminicenantes bacterium]
MKLSNRTVLITGGTGGIGLGLAEAFDRAKSRVIVCGRNPEKIDALKRKFPEITAFRCDVGDPRQRRSLADEVVGRFPDLDILINNAGVQRYIDLKKGSDELVSGDDEIAVNFTAVVEMTALLIGHLMKRPSAAVINVGSGLAFMPMAHTPIYNATKAAIHTYSLALRQQLKDTPVRVIEIVPPMVDTDLNKEGRARARIPFRGIGLAEYIPTVVKGLEDDEETIFHGEGKNVMTAPRAESESRLLKPSR